MLQMILYFPDRIAAANHGLISGSIRPKLTGNGNPATSQRVFSVFLGPGIELEVFDEDLTLFPHE